MERLTANSSPLILCLALYTSLWGERPMTASKSKWSSKVNSCGCITLGVRRIRAAAVAINTCVTPSGGYALHVMSRRTFSGKYGSRYTKQYLATPYSIAARLR